MLEGHRKWVESNGAEGKSADLRGMDLQGVDLAGVNLQGANLSGANLQGANLCGANLHGAMLLRTVLREADLQDADLIGATGLLAGQLAGANVCAAKLPEVVLKFEELANVDEASRSAQTLLFSILLGCVYTWLTIATTTDARLLANSATSPLPVIGGALPIVGFYWTAPLLLLGLYFYFHLHLQRLWEGLANLPAIFPDGRSLEKRAYPWLLNGLVRKHFVHLRGNHPPLSHLQAQLSILLAWWVVPATQLLFWARYLPLHHWGGTALHIALLGVSISAAVVFRRLTTATLAGQYRDSVPWPFPWKSAAAMTLGSYLVLSILSLGAIHGVPSDQYTSSDPNWVGSRVPDLMAIDIRRLVPRTFELMLYSPFAQFEETGVSTKPPNWMGQRKEELVQVEGARLKHRNLRYASAYRAFLVNADLRGADVHGANLREADLRGANLEGANLSGANLRVARLEWAKLGWATLHGAILTWATLREADLRGTQLQGATLVWADLQKADLQGADLRWANLQLADLQEADLSGVALEGADLTATNLRGANLRTTTGLTREQLEPAIVDENTHLPDFGAR
ncbi:MAG: pentapeptide repeat-containing protein [Candidatus Entotheonellia bacterium]